MALFDLYGRGLAVITDHLRPLHSTPFHCRNADDAPGIITGEATPTGTGHPHHQARPNSRQSERTCRARQSVRTPAPLTTPPPHALPPSRTSNSTCTALLKVRISSGWYGSRPSTLRCSSASTPARRRWSKASAQQTPPSLTTSTRRRATLAIPTSLRSCSVKRHHQKHATTCNSRSSGPVSGRPSHRKQEAEHGARAQATR